MVILMLEEEQVERSITEQAQGYQPEGHPLRHRRFHSEPRKKARRQRVYEMAGRRRHA